MFAGIASAIVFCFMSEINIERCPKSRALYRSIVKQSFPLLLSCIH